MTRSVETTCMLARKRRKEEEKLNNHRLDTLTAGAVLKLAELAKSFKV